jgi:hypothetical protein
MSLRNNLLGLSEAFASVNPGVTILPINNIYRSKAYSGPVNVQVISGVAIVRNNDIDEKEGRYDNHGNYIIKVRHFLSSFCRNFLFDYT